MNVKLENVQSDSGAPIPTVFGNNVIAGNILPTSIPGPILLPTSAFIDGGGNHCGPPPAGSPIACLP